MRSPTTTSTSTSCSVKTRRTQDEIASNVEQIGAGRHSTARVKARHAGKARADARDCCHQSRRPGTHWLYEIKWDGVRALCSLRDGNLQIHSRAVIAVTSNIPNLLDLPKLVNASTAILDGEICVLDENGRAQLQPHPAAHLCQSERRVPHLAAESPATLFISTFFMSTATILRGASLDDRKRVLNSLVKPGDQIRLSETFDTDGEQHVRSGAPNGSGRCPRQRSPQQVRDRPIQLAGKS